MDFDKIDKSFEKNEENNPSDDDEGVNKWGWNLKELYKLALTFYKGKTNFNYKVLQWF